MTPPPRPSLEELAAGRIDDEDLQTLQRAARVYDALDPVPDGLVDRIRFGITLDALEAEIAQLQRSGDLAGVRSDDATETKTVTFTSASLTTMVTVTEISSERVRIDGWVAPGGGASVELRRVDGSESTIADADGRFVFADVARGLAQFVLRPLAPTGQRPVITPSVEL
jgi:hypothetical protein